MQTRIQTRTGAVIVNSSDSNIIGRRVSINLFTETSDCYYSWTQEEALQIGEAILQQAKTPAPENKSPDSSLVSLVQEGVPAFLMEDRG